MEISSNKEKDIQPGQGSYFSRSAKNNLTVILFLFPSLVLFLVFLVYPILQSVYYSFFDWKGFGAAVDFVAFDNYVQIFADDVFITAIKNAGLIIILSLGVQLPLALLLAILVGRKLPGRAFFRTVFFLPYVFSEVMAAVMWLSLFNPDPQLGLINAIITLIPGVEAQGFLGDLDQVMFCLFVVLTWKYFGFYLLLFMTGLQNIPAELEEAAKIDGANTLQLFTRIIIPLLESTIRLSAYMSVLGSIQQFILVWVMTHGGPVNVSEMMATYMYRYGFIRFALGYGSAVAIIMFIFCMVISLVFQKLLPQRDYLGGY